MDGPLAVNQRHGSADLLEAAQTHRYADPARGPHVRHQRRPLDVFHDDVGAVLVLRQQAHVEDLHQVPPAVVVAGREDASQHDGVAEQVRRGFLGEARLARHLDGDGPHELAAEVLLGAEDRAEGAAGPRLDQLVFAGERLAEQALLKRRRAFHDTSRRVGQG